MVKDVAAISGRYDPDLRESVNDLLRRLTAQQVLPREVSDVFHAVRRQGNQATHEFTGTPGEALSTLKSCQSLGVWYRRAYGRDPDFTPGPFVPPKSSGKLDDETRAKIAEYQGRVLQAEASLREARASAENLAKTKAAAEELARQAQQDSEEWAKAALDQEATASELSGKLARLQKAAEAEPEQLRMAFKRAARQAASKLELDEDDTRLLIDVRLIDMGWEADSKELLHSKGARPEKGRSLQTTDETHELEEKQHMAPSVRAALSPTGKQSWSCNHNRRAPWYKRRAREILHRPAGNVRHSVPRLDPVSRGARIHDRSSEPNRDRRDPRPVRQASVGILATTRTLELPFGKGGAQE
jgi:hypothetical protein